MFKKSVLLFFVGFCFAIYLPAQRLDAQWQRVVNAQTEGHPRTALKEARALFEMAQEKQQIGQMLRAYLAIMQCRNDISPDSFSVDIAHLVNWSDSCSSILDKSMLRMVAGLCEMNQSHFEDKAMSDSLINLANKHVCWALGLEGEDGKRLFLQLGQTSSSRYSPLVVEGRDSKIFHHDLLSLYRQSVLSAFQIKKSPWLLRLLKRDEAYYQSVGNQAAALQVALQQQEFLTGLETEKEKTNYLQNLAKQYASVDACAEVYRRLALQYQSDGSLPNSASQALSTVRKGMALYPNYQRIDQLKELEQQIITPYLGCTVNSCIYPNGQLSLQLSAYNVLNLNVSWYVVPYQDCSGFKPESLSSDDLRAFRKKAKLIKTAPLTISSDKVSRVNSTFTLSVPSQVGCYLLAIEPTNCGDYPSHKAPTALLACRVSRLQLLQVPLSSDSVKWYVLNKQTGHPVPFASLLKFRLTQGKKGREYTYVSTFQTDGNGCCVLPSDSYQNQSVFQACSADDYSDFTDVQSSYSNPSAVNRQQHVNLFTDRSVYRPGQTVKVNLLAYEQEKDSLNVLTHKDYSLNLRDRQGKTIRQSSITTDEFGSASASFELPKDCQTGVFSIQTSYSSASFRVEAYKRPTFDVQWNAVGQAYALGDTLLVSGFAKSFNGSPVQHARVVVHSTFRQMSWLRCLNQIELKSDTLLTDGNGYFNVGLPLVIPSGSSYSMTDYNSGIWRADFQLSAAVTAASGETQQCEMSVQIGARPLQMLVELPALVEKQSKQFAKVQLVNLANQPQQRQLKYAVIRKSDNAVVGNDSCESNQPFVPAWLATLPSDNYKLRVSCDSLSEERSFSLFSMADTKPMSHTDLWTYTMQNEVDELHNWQIQFGTSHQDAYLIYQLYGATKCVEQGTVTLSNELRTWSVPYQAAYGDCMRVVFTLVKDNEVYQKQLTATYVKPNKKLSVEWLSFRDKVQPGSKEQWRLRLTLPDGTPADAQLMAVMYDASLDEVYPHQWHFNVGFSRCISTFMPKYVSRSSQANLFFPQWKQYAQKEWLLDAFDSNLFSFPPSFGFYPGRRLYKSNAAGALFSPQMETDAVTLVRAPAMQLRAEANAVSDKPASIHLRTDMRETAFFFPGLRTDGKGVASLDFVLPDALTEWRLLLLAHTRHMAYSDCIEKRVQARKSFMVQPNLPRFIRATDETAFPVTIQNVSDTLQQGWLYLELTDSTLSRVIYKEKLRFEVKANETTAACFRYKMDAKFADSQALCRIYAQSQSFTDGEQQLLPVLSDKVWITEARAVYLKDEPQTVSLAEMLGHGRQWNASSTLKIETVKQPLALVAKLLPVLGNPQGDNALDLASAYYSLALSVHLQVTQPVLMQSESLANDSLKACEWLAQLEKLQQADGGFSWYPGMRSSMYITQQVAEWLCRLHTSLPQLPNQSRFDRVLRRASYYLDQQAILIYKELLASKKERERYLPSDFVCHYLYFASMNSLKASAEVREARQFFLSRLAEASKQASIYNRALSCITLARHNKTVEALLLLQSVLEYSVYTDELGRYFDTSKAEYSWRNYRIPTLVKAIEALQLLQPNQVVCDPAQSPLRGAEVCRQFKQHLLNQKRTQQWENSACTTDAISALLDATDTTQVLKSLDEQLDTVVYTSRNYAKMPSTWHFDGTPQSSPAGLSWASVTLRSRVPYEEVVSSPTTSGFTLKRYCFKEAQLNGKKTLLPLDKYPLRVGDKVVVKYLFKCDRDMDFVTLRASRAACAEPINRLSGYRWQDGIGFYQAQSDNATLFHFDKVRKGQYTIEERFYVTRPGVYQTGLAEIKGTYCPEFCAHTPSAQWIINQ